MLRFCRAIGLAGYPELRIALARAAQSEETDQSAGAPNTGQISADRLAERRRRKDHPRRCPVRSRTPVSVPDLDVLLERP